MPAWITALAIQFALRQLSKYGETIDWEKVKVDAVARIKPLVWGPLEAPLADLIDGLMDCCKLAMARAGTVEVLLERLAAHDLPAASKELAVVLEQVEHAGAELAAEGAWHLHEAA